MTFAATPSPVRAALGLLVSPWRGLGASHFYLAALVGLAAGLFAATGIALFAGKLNGIQFPVNVGMNMVNALLLLLAITAAGKVPTTHVPPWLPFVVAALVATVAFTAAGMGFGKYVLSHILPSPGPPRNWWLHAWANFPIDLVVSILIALGYMRGLHAWQRTNALRTLQLERTHLARKSYESRLQALQARVDPRFLFETLAAIETTHAADFARGQRMIDDLIVYLRAALPALDLPASTLNAELALARTWLDIKCLRHGDQLSFTISAPETQDVRMPPMVLQPLIQHAVDCFVDSPYERAGIAIAVTVDAERVSVAITVPGPPFADESPATSIVRARLEAVYGRRASLSLGWTDEERSRAGLEIPYERTDRHPR